VAIARRRTLPRYPLGLIGPFGRSNRGRAGGQSPVRDRLVSEGKRMVFCDSRAGQRRVAGPARAPCVNEVSSSLRTQVYLPPIQNVKPPTIPFSCMTVSY